MSLISNNWPEWTRLYWLFCAPLALLLLYALYRAEKNQHDWRSLLPKAFHAILLSPHTAQQRNMRYGLLGGAWLFTLLALLGPNWETSAEQPIQKQHFAPLVIAIQLTPDMLANDLPPSRLMQVQEKILSVLKQREAAFTALVVYAGSAHTLVPLSNDFLTSENLLQALQPDLMPVPGQRADLAIERAIELLQQGAEGEGQILLISTGVSVSEQNAIAKQLKKKQIQLKILGVGSTAGAPIMHPTQGYLLTDTNGAIIISRLNETSLQLLSKETNSAYAQMRGDNSDLQILDLFSRTDSNFTTALAGQAKAQQDQGYWFILPILFFVALFARRGSLLILLICLLPMQSFAFDLDDLWLRPDQQGAKLIKQQPGLAAEHFTDLQWRATALYLAEDYQAAAELFARFDTAQAHYNRGNALALADLLPEAVEAYQQALRQAPDMLAAQYNLAFIEEYLTASQTKATETESSDSQEQLADSLANPLSTTTPATSATASESSEGNEDLAETANTDSTQALNTQHSAEQLSQPEQPTAQSQSLSTQQPVHLESWLEQIPDNPSELLKRKFWYEQNMQEAAP